MTAYKPTRTTPEATIILRKVNRYAQASSTDPRMIAKAKMKAPAAKVPNPPHICYIAKDNEDAAAYHHVQSPEQANHQQKKVPTYNLCSA